MLIEGRVAVVTGAGAGIGRAIAEKFAFAKAVVALVDVDRAAADAAAQAIVSRGGMAQGFVADVSNAAAVAAMTDQVVAKFGGVDILVNNAGIRFIRPFLEHTEEEWRRTLDVNLTGPFICAKAVVPHMLRAKRGKIVNVSSVAGAFGRPQRSAYCASKGGLISFTQALAADLRATGICVNALAPALIDTPLNEGFASDSGIADVWGKETLIGRWGTPSEVADAALFLASDASNFITGSVLTVDGGWTAAMVRATES